MRNLRLRGVNLLALGESADKSQNHDSNPGFKFQSALDHCCNISLLLCFPNRILSLSIDLLEDSTLVFMHPSFYLYYWWNILRIPTIAHKSILEFRMSSSILACSISRKVGSFWSLMLILPWNMKGLYFAYGCRNLWKRQ